MGTLKIVFSDFVNPFMRLGLSFLYTADTFFPVTGFIIPDQAEIMTFIYKPTTYTAGAPMAIRRLIRSPTVFVRYGTGIRIHCTTGARPIMATIADIFMRIILMRLLLGSRLHCTTDITFPNVIPVTDVEQLEMMIFCYCHPAIRTNPGVFVLSVNRNPFTEIMHVLLREVTELTGLVMIDFIFWGIFELMVFRYFYLANTALL
jgi:hypothetical protein